MKHDSSGRRMLRRNAILIGYIAAIVTVALVLQIVEVIR